MKNSMRWSVASVAAVLGWTGLSAPAADAVTYTVKVTCTVPKLQPERQLASNSCLNYVPDGTQTFTARVTDSTGRAVSGVWVTWSDNSSAAHFRARNNPCRTGSNGTCSDELVVRNPKKGMKITVTATVGGSSGVGYLTFA
jgi:hypothetical protein